MARPPLCSSDRIGRPESEKSLGSLSAITKLTIIPTHRLGISRRQSLQTRGSDHCSPRCAVVERPQSWLPGWSWSSALGTNVAFLFKQRGAVLAPPVRGRHPLRQRRGPLPFARVLARMAVATGCRDVRGLAALRGRVRRRTDAREELGCWSG